MSTKTNSLVLGFHYIRLTRHHIGKRIRNVNDSAIQHFKFGNRAWVHIRIILKTIHIMRNVLHSRRPGRTDRLSIKS